MADRANSMCSVYADIIEYELTSPETDMDEVHRMLDNIRKYCTTAGGVPGKTPEHLEEYQFTPET